MRIANDERTYPQFSRLLADLGVATQPSEMSFSVCCERTGLAYSGGSLDGLFAQRRNLLRSAFLGMVRDVLRLYAHEALRSLLARAESRQRGRLCHHDRSRPPERR